MRYRNSRAKGGKINEAGRDVGLDALPRLPMHKYPIVHVHIYIANMQYIRNCLQIHDTSYSRSPHNAPHSLVVNYAILGCACTKILAVLNSAI